METKIKPSSQKFKGYLAEKNVTYKKLAELMNISTASVTRKISGNGLWDWVELKTIKEKLNIDNDTFLSIFFEK